MIERHDRPVEDIVGHLKFAATRSLIEQGFHPFQDLRKQDGTVPTMWTKRASKVFLDGPEDVKRAVDYVEGNPEKEGKRRQCWSFIAGSRGAPRMRGG